MSTHTTTDPTSLGEPATPPRGPVTSASYSITVRLTADGDPASIGRIATAVGSAGGAVTAIDVVDSRPDGLTVDSEGGVWVALYGGGAVHRYGPDGTLTEVVEVPVSKPTAVALAGDDLRTLVITTTREGLAGDAEPLAGALFAARADVPGRLPRPFRG